MKKIIAALAFLVPSISFGAVHIQQGDSAALATVTASSETVRGQLSVTSPAAGLFPSTDTLRVNMKNSSFGTSSMAWNSTVAGGFSITASTPGSATTTTLQLDNVLNITSPCSTPGGISFSETGGRSTCIDGGIITMGDASGGYSGLKSSNTTTGSPIWVLPGTDGTSGQALVTDGSKNLSFTTIISGGGAGYAVEPATLTFNLAKGVTGSTFSFTGTQQSTITYGLTVGSITIAGSGAGQISLATGTPVNITPGNVGFWADSSSNTLTYSLNSGSTYTVAGTSITTTSGNCVKWTGLGSLGDAGAACGSGSGSGSGIVSPGTFTWTNSLGINVSTAVIASNGSLTLLAPTPANFIKISLVDTLATYEFYQSGIQDHTMTIGGTPSRITVNDGISTTGGTIQTQNAIVSAAAAASPNLTNPGIVDLWSTSGQGVFVSFNEQGVANNGTFGFTAGSGKLRYKQGAEDITSGTEMWGVNTDGGMTPYSRTKAQLIALSPTAAGELFYCSDCTTDGMVISTGTAAGAFGRISARSTAIN